MTTGEGGAVYTTDRQLAAIAESHPRLGPGLLLPAGRPTPAASGSAGNWGTLPEGYDHKYTYSHFGYNLKMTDLQAAVGLAQVEKLPDFVSRPAGNHAFRRRRWRRTTTCPLQRPHPARRRAGSAF